MKTRKLTKVLSVLLVVAMLAAVMSVMSFAARPVKLTVVKGPDRTVYYEGYDNNKIGDNVIWCDTTGIVVELEYDDGTTETLDWTTTKGNITCTSENFVIGENEAVVRFDTGSSMVDASPITITVKKNPVKSIEVIKMPNKTIYDWDNDVLTKNSTFDDFAELYPDFFDNIILDSDMTLADLKAFYEEHPDYWEEDVMSIFTDDIGLLIPDLTGMEIKITYTDGTSEILGDDDDYNTYDGYKFPVYAYAENDAVVKLGANKYYVMVMGNAAPFEMTVKAGSASAKPEEKPTEPAQPTEPTQPTQPQKPEDPKAPEIPNPNTDGSSVAAAAVIAVMSACGLALIPSKKER